MNHNSTAGHIAFLLRKRFRVLISTPYSKVPAGEILTEAADGSFTDSEGRIWSEGVLREYSDLFQLMEWWEERELADMPEYVNVIYADNCNSIYAIGKVNKVLRWEFWHGGTFFVSKGATVFLYQCDTTPATLDEYLTYQSSL